MSSELISIVMPVYNAAHFLDYSIPSVLSQTYQNIELVIVDDASTDNSYEIMQKYTKLDSRVRAFSIPHVEGPKPTRDNAIMNAKGDWIVFVDADDAIDNDFIEKLWKRHIETGADFVCPVMRLVERKGKPVIYSIPKESFDLDVVYNGTEAMIRTLSSWEFGTIGALISRENITNLYQLPNSLPYNDECDSRIYLNNSKLVAFTDASYYYTQHVNSSTHDKSVNALLFEILNFVGLTHYYDNKYGIGNALSIYSRYETANLFRKILPQVLLTSWKRKQCISSQKKKVLDEAYAIFRQQCYKHNYLLVQYYRLLMLIIRYLR